MPMIGRCYAQQRREQCGILWISADKSAQCFNFDRQSYHWTIAEQFLPAAFMEVEDIR